MRPREGHVAAEQGLALALEARAHRIGQRAHAGDDGNTERNAGDEDVEPLESVALLAQCQRKRQRQTRATRAPAASRRPQPSCGGELRAGDLPVEHAHEAAATPGEVEIVGDEH